MAKGHGRTGPDEVEIANAVLASLSVLVRRLRQLQLPDEPTWPERAALSRLGRLGPMTSAELARLEQISPQSMGATVATLEGRGFIDRRRDPRDGRRVLLSVSTSGKAALRDRRAARVKQLADSLSKGFDSEELDEMAAAAPLLERLAQLL